MNKAFFTIASAMTLSLFGCVFDSGEAWRDGAYSVMWINLPSELALNYEVGNGGYISRVNPTVIAVGSNKNYVVAKQHLNSENPMLNYYIIDRLKDHKYADSQEFVTGPLSKTEYENHKGFLKLPEFTKHF